MPGRGSGKNRKRHASQTIGSDEIHHLSYANNESSASSIT